MAPAAARSAGKPMLLRTSFYHFVQHTGVNTSGERDFTQNFTTTLPSSFEPPAAVECHWPVT